MRVVTIGGFGGTEQGDSWVYEGEAWLFRFGISSPEDFFRSQLPRLIRTFEIDSRQIYELSLYGKPGMGLREARVSISFEEPPTQDQIDKLREQRLPEADESGLHRDIFSGRLKKFLQMATPKEKTRLAQALRSRKGWSR
jgi:hypothetical protein